jgi:AraC-like DNA-binding protein
MLQDSSRQLLRAAALETIDRIRTDHEQVPSKLKPLLAYIEDHLFDADLSVNRIKKACGVRDNSVAIHFHACVGQPPHAYISQCRMEVASRLLRDSELPVWKISDLLGFSSIQVFSRAFYRWAKERPSTYRRIHRRNGSEVDDSLLEAELALETGGSIVPARLTEDFWRRALTGSLRDEEASELIRNLLELYPPRRR